jgi:hypothetical protein
LPLATLPFRSNNAEQNYDYNPYVMLLLIDENGGMNFRSWLVNFKVYHLDNMVPLRIDFYRFHFGAVSQFIIQSS